MKNDTHLVAPPICRYFKTVLLIVSVLLISACTKYEYHESKIVKLEKPSDIQMQRVNEQALLDIGITLFDEGVDELDDESYAYANLRRSESVWFSSQLRDTLEKSQAWGLVRTLPSKTSVTDVSIIGQLLESNGEVVKLTVTVSDSSGKQWFTKEYDQRASSYAYNPEVRLPEDPFQALFNEIANDLLSYQNALTIEQRLKIRNITKVRFARDFVPAAFDDFLVKQKTGEFDLQRIPAANDPMMLRVGRIQARNDLYLDVVQDYYRAFNYNMASPYNEWRKNSYKEVVYERQLRDQARKERIAGVITILGGVALAVEGDSNVSDIGSAVAIFGGAQLFRRSYGKAEEANIHREALLEMGASLEAELESSVVDLQDRSVTLSGTVEDQFKEWRRILSRMFLLDEGLIDDNSRLSPEVINPIQANNSEVELVN